MAQNQFVDYILDLLSPYGHIKARAMFGAHGIYKDGVIAGIIVQDELYFKTDKDSSVEYEAPSSKPFTYEANGKIVKMSYWQVPLDIMEDKELLGQWLERAKRISLEGKSQKKRQKKFSLRPCKKFM